MTDATGNEPDEVAAFEQQRPTLLSIAYHMLGSMADAEDVVQDAYLRWRDVDPAEVRSARAYLSAVVTRLCLDRMKSARARREAYTGEWLPEPVETRPGRSGEPRDVGYLSLAVLVLLETLSPAERAAFLLAEIFDFTHAEVAAALGKSEAAARQLASRARSRIAEGKARYDAPDEERLDLLGRFMNACATGDLDGLLAVLAPDAVLVSDGGGKVRAALNPIRSAAHVARFFASVSGRLPEGFGVRVATINGEPAVVASAGGQIQSVLALAVENGKIARVYLVVNPDKLAHVTTSA